MPMRHFTFVYTDEVFDGVNYRTIPASDYWEAKEEWDKQNKEAGKKEDEFRVHLVLMTEGRAPEAIR